MADWEFDPAKDAINLAKHGVSLSRASEMSFEAVFPDGRFAEARYRAYGRLDGRTFCVGFTIRGDAFRAITLRRCHHSEFHRFVG